MKSKDKLKIDKDITKVQKKRLNSVLSRLKYRGKIPKAYGRDKVRVHHKGYYFEYSVATGKWSYTRNTGRHTWMSSNSLDDFLEAAEEFAFLMTNKIPLQRPELKLYERIFFGKHNGKKVIDVCCEDPSYLAWAEKEGILKIIY
jgi:hypothetical protein